MNRQNTNFRNWGAPTFREVVDAQPCEAGLEVTDASGVQTGNSDIEPSSVWAPVDHEPERYPLPGCEHLVGGAL